jgi:cytochrome c peroxidase/fibronectin type 3 domain-containing protein
MKNVTPLVLLFSLVVITHSAIAQGPPPPPPLQPLQPPVAPAGNPITVAKTNLGKVLFWDEQLSSTRTISCGTCHQPFSGGSDPRSLRSTSVHPGPDGVLNTGDDITGSPGVIRNNANGDFELEDFFGLTVQVTSRYAPSAINSGYADELFWDGRAGSAFADPVTGATLIAAGASLESQAAGPPASSVEMAHQGRDWTSVAERILHSRPLALSPSLPADLEAWVAGRDYGALFEDAFGSAGVTPARIIMAIATYERTLVSNQAPFDSFIAGVPGALTALEQQGLNLFRTNDCVVCHGGNRLTDDRFHYIGVRPQSDDSGRFAVTGRNGDLGQMKTPSLRNVALRNEYMHNGRFETLEEVVDFYDRGGDFTAANKDPNIRPLNLTEGEKAALVAFLGRPLTDTRVTEETGPFSRPALFSESALQAVVSGVPVDDEQGNTPRIVAIHPALVGTSNFTVGLDQVARGKQVILVMDDEPVTAAAPPAAEGVRYYFDLTSGGTTARDTLGVDHSGFATRTIAIPRSGLLRGTKLYGKWYVSGESSFGASSSFDTTLFGDTAGLLDAPANLTASENESPSVVDLAWSAATGAIRYDVYRGGSDSFVDAAYLGSSETTGYTDTQVEANATYYYWVVSVNADEASAPSDSAIGSTFDLSGFTLTVTDGSSTSAAGMTWAAQIDAAGYRILRGTSSSPAELSEIATVSGSGESYDDVTGVAERSYYYRVVALDSGGSVLGYSAVDMGHRALAVPQGFSASSGTYRDRVEITWSAVSDATSYTLYGADVSGSFSELSTTSQVIFQDTAAIPGATRRYYVVANNVYGNSVDSAVLTGLRSVSPPTGMTATYGTNLGAVVLTWTGAEGVTRYVVYRSLSGALEDAVEIATVEGGSYADESAESGQSYQYWVASLDGNDNPILDPEVSVAGLAGEVIPDLMIGSGISTRGDDVYNSSGSGQTLPVKRKRFATASVSVEVENDGTITDVVRYSGSGGNRWMNVSYFRSSPESQNLTASVKAGIALSGDVDSGSTETFEVKMKPVRSRSASKKKRYRMSLNLRAVSTLNATRSDLVKVNGVWSSR